MIYWLVSCLNMSLIFCAHVSVLLGVNRIGQRLILPCISPVSYCWRFIILHRATAEPALLLHFHILITLWYRAYAKENAKQLSKQLTSTGAWKSLSLELGCLQWSDDKPSALQGTLAPENCYDPQWGIKWGSEPVQKESFNTTGSPGVIGITAYAHDQLQEESLFPFDFC